MVYLWVNLVIREVHAKSILSRSGIEGISYTINPYTGCSHGCRYCYATFMKKYTGHAEPWGGFVDVKVNAAALLERQLSRAKKGTVILSSVTDPYQAAESKYKLTRACLEVLSRSDFSVEVLTKSPLVTRDVDVMRAFGTIEVGLTISTDDDAVRKMFEPRAPSIEQRLRALEILHRAGVRTYVFIAPLLPMRAGHLARRIREHAHRVMIDAMNYPSKTLRIYRAAHLEEWLNPSRVKDAVATLQSELADRAVEFC